MQYEVVILELMTRIKKLEEEVAALKDVVGHFNGQDERDLAVSEVSTAPEVRRGQGSYKKMTDEMVMICYGCGKQLSDGANASELADVIVDETGMNRILQLCIYTQ